MDPMLPKVLSFTDSEVDALKPLMRDVQEAASAFYARTAATASVDDLGTEVRTFLSATQTLNERLFKSIADTGTYRANLAGTGLGELLDAVRYVRNVTQHVLHVVRPSSDAALIGGQHGLRLYVVWDDVPVTAHSSLHPPTQALRPAFEKHLQGKNVTDTMLAVLEGIASVAPQIVHRSLSGEWSGFPLKNQPAVVGRLHPEEPTELQDAFAWLNSRAPGCDSRIAVGRVTVDGEQLIVGYNVKHEYLTRAFLERPEQIEADSSQGFRYYESDVSELAKRLVEHRAGSAPRTATPAYRVTEPLQNWARPLRSPSLGPDWGVDLADAEWDRVVRFAQSGYLPDELRYENRRIQRLDNG